MKTLGIAAVVLVTAVIVWKLVSGSGMLETFRTLPPTAPPSKTGYSFDPVAYASRYVDLKNAFGNDLRALTNHWVTTGIGEGRNGAREESCGPFVPAVYGRINNLQDRDAKTLLKHYRVIGVPNGLDYCTGPMQTVPPSVINPIGLNPTTTPPPIKPIVTLPADSIYPIITTTPPPSGGSSNTCTNLRQRRDQLVTNMLRNKQNIARLEERRKRTMQNYQNIESRYRNIQKRMETECRTMGDPLVYPIR